MRTAYFYLTWQGKALAEKISSLMGGDIMPKNGFKENVRFAFNAYDALVFIMASGIVVRTVAPLLKSKETDPAVVVLDQNGKFVISLLSGHLGGANTLAQKIAEKIKAVPVITTATDVCGALAFDEFAKANGLLIGNIHALKIISGAAVEGEKIQLLSDTQISGEIPDKITFSENAAAKVIISDRLIPTFDENALLLIPKDIVIGIGCRKNISFERLESCFHEILLSNKINERAVFKAATVSLKAEEPAILKLCEKYSLELEIIRNEDIEENAELFEQSDFVKKTAGVSSVAEACAYLGSNKGERLTGKVRFDGVTMSLCRKRISVSFERTE